MISRHTDVDSRELSALGVNVRLAIQPSVGRLDFTPNGAVIRVRFEENTATSKEINNRTCLNTDNSEWNEMLQIEVR